MSPHSVAGRQLPNVSTLPCHLGSAWTRSAKQPAASLLGATLEDGVARVGFTSEVDISATGGAIRADRVCSGRPRGCSIEPESQPEPQRGLEGWHRAARRLDGVGASGKQIESRSQAHLRATATRGRWRWPSGDRGMVRILTRVAMLSTSLRSASEREV